VGDSIVVESAMEQSGAPPNMLCIPGGTFRMGSDEHYQEKAPAHCVTVDGFWIDRAPVTNRHFKEFVRAGGHVTCAEVAPDITNYPGAFPHMLHAGSLVFTPPGHPVDAGARLSARRITAAATGRPRATPKRWIRPRAISDFDVS
jgi:formylglycine-generating enzyme required for sulfatase activity